jgi:uncharacterized protein
MDGEGPFPWLVALGLMLIFEGLLPLLAPTAWKEMMQRIALFREGQIRFVGLASILAGVLLLLVTG